MRLLAASLVLTACASGRSFTAKESVTGGLASAPLEAPKTLEMKEPVQNIIAQAGPIYVAGQPSEAALRKLAAEGVTVVINLRTPQEMDDRKVVPFDEAALVKELGMDYVHLPMGGKDHPSTPELVDKFARALAAHQGKALLHCTVAFRASNMWAAYLIRHRGVPQAKALEEARSINMGRPAVADLLDAEMVLEPKAR